MVGLRQTVLWSAIQCTKVEPEEERGESERREEGEMGCGLPARKQVATVRNIDLQGMLGDVVRRMRVRLEMWLHLSQAPRSCSSSSTEGSPRTPRACPAAECPPARDPVKIVSELPTVFTPLLGLFSLTRRLSSAWKSRLNQLARHVQYTQRKSSG